MPSKRRHARGGTSTAANREKENDNRTGAIDLSHSTTDMPEDAPLRTYDSPSERPMSNPCGGAWITKNYFSPNFTSELVREYADTRGFLARSGGSSLFAILKCYPPRVFYNFISYDSGGNLFYVPCSAYSRCLRNTSEIANLAHLTDLHKECKRLYQYFIHHRVFN